MGINKEFYTKRTKIVWDGQDVCEVRGITPDDIARVMAENTADMESVIVALEKDESLSQMTLDNAEAINQAVQANSAKMFSTVLMTAPTLVAKLIAIAADDADEWEFIKTNYTVPLQFEILQQVALLTFVDAEGFKQFLGKAMALVGNVRGDQRPTAPRPSLTDNMAG